MPPRVQRSCVAGSGPKVRWCFSAASRRWSSTTPGCTRAMRRAGSISRILAMYLEKSRMTATLQHCPARDVPPPRQSRGAPNSRHSATVGEDIVGVAGEHDADGNLAVVGAVGGIEGASCHGRSGLHRESECAKLRPGPTRPPAPIVRPGRVPRMGLAYRRLSSLVRGRGRPARLTHVRDEIGSCRPPLQR